MRTAPIGRTREDAVQYLSLSESVRRLRAAGVNARPRTVQEWIRDQKVRDIWVLGGHTYIYDEELDALIAGQRG